MPHLASTCNMPMLIYSNIGLFSGENPYFEFALGGSLASHGHGGKYVAAEFGRALVRTGEIGSFIPNLPLTLYGYGVLPFHA